MVLLKVKREVFYMDERALEYDVVVVGCGPAGLSAAVNAKARNRSVMVAGGQLCSPKLRSAPIIDNYLGLAGVTGEELRQAFIKHAEEAQVPIKNCRVTEVIPQGNKFFVQTDTLPPIVAGAVVLALGVTSQETLPGEKQFLGRGVSYCATCDGMFFKGKKVAVIAYYQKAEEEVKLLSQICEKVYFLPFYKKATVKDLGNNVEIIQKEPTCISGEKTVERLILDQGSLEIDGVFIIRETIPVAQLAPGIQISDNFIEVDSTMATAVPGVYAAGDCVGEPFQLSKAVGQGQVAALSADKYLS